MRIELNPTDGQDKSEEYLSPPTVMTAKGEKVINPTKGMPFNKKIAYYATYYLPKILFVTLLLAIVFSLLFFALRKKDPAVNILFINHHQTDTLDIADTLKPYLTEQGLSPTSVNINASVNMNLSNFATYEDKNTFDTLLASRSFSLMFSDEETFQACADATFFRYLSEYLSSSELNAYGDDNLLWGYDDQTKEKYICGLKLTRENCEWLRNTNYESACLGILFSNVPDEQIKPLLKYILNYKETGSD